MKSRKTNEKIASVAGVGFALVLLTASPQTALAQQWTTNGNNISNTNSGNVGIGTTNPGSLLQMDRNAITGPTITFNNTHAASGNGALTFMKSGTPWYSFGSDGAGNGTRELLIYDYFNAKRRLTIASGGDMFLQESGGNVGIGTTSPIFSLDIDRNQNGLTVVRTSNWNGGSSAAAGLWTQTAGGVGIFGTGGPGYSYVNVLQNRAFIDANWNLSGIVLNNEGPAPIIFSTENVEKMRVQTSGNVGIGNSAPAFKLDVAGVIRSSTGGFKFPDGTVQTTAAGSGTITGVTAGAGLTGGGAGGAVTLDIGAGTGLSVASDSVSVNYGSTAGTAVQGNTSIAVSAGDGLSGGGPVTLGAGGTLTLTNADKGSSQSIFKNVANAAGTAQFAAGSNNDTVRFEGTGGATVSFDSATKKVIINTAGATSSAANVSAGQFGQNVGGGDFSFPANLTVTGTVEGGNIKAKYQDVAEWVPAAAQIPSGTVVILDSTKSNHVISSTRAYDTRVAGVISEKPGIALGESGENKVLVATTGRVRIKVDATRSPIHIGDLLVTSDVSGMAMKSEALNIGGVQIHRPGTLIGKALEPLEKGKGEILVLLSLQ